MKILIASRHIKRKKASLPVDVRRSKTLLLLSYLLNDYEYEIFSIVSSARA